jgi:hypothetical protein
LRNRDVHLSPAQEATLRVGRRPETPIEALMMAPAFEDVEESVQELQPLREAVADCIDQLNDQDRFIVDAVNSEMVSLEELGRRLGVSKPHAWRLRNAAYERLAVHLRSHPYLAERFDLNEDESGDIGI